MIVSPPPLDTVVYPQISVFIPYFQIQPATLISLIGYNYQSRYLPGDYDMSNYFKERWEEGKTFINIEQDIVVWPGAVKALWDCPEECCVYDFHLPCHWDRSLEREKVGLPIGCIKITDRVIAKSQGHWDTPIMWNVCDLHFTKLTDRIKVHQHYPSVVNANPVLLPKGSIT